MIRLIAPALLLALGACATTRPVEVTRFNLGTPIERGSVAIRPAEGMGDVGLEFRTYAGAVGRELQRLGYVEGAPATSLYLANVGVMTGIRASLAQRSPVSIGIGGGSGGFGIGGLFGIGGGSGETVVTELHVQLARRSDSTVVWEGRAQAEARAGTDAADPDVVASRLAAALFQDFPGRNGEVTTVR